MNDSGDPWILLRRVLGALTEGYPHVTLIEGWAFRVYALHPDARPVHGAPDRHVGRRPGAVSEDLQEWRGQCPAVFRTLRRVRGGLSFVTWDLIVSAARVGTSIGPERLLATLRAALDRVEPTLASALGARPP